MMLNTQIIEDLNLSSNQWLLLNPRYQLMVTGNMKIPVEWHMYPHIQGTVYGLTRIKDHIILDVRNHQDAQTVLDESGCLVLPSSWIEGVETWELYMHVSCYQFVLRPKKNMQFIEPKQEKRVSKRKREQDKKSPLTNKPEVKNIKIKNKAVPEKRGLSVKITSQSAPLSSYFTSEEISIDLPLLWDIYMFNLQVLLPPEWIKAWNMKAGQYLAFRMVGNSILGKYYERAPAYRPQKKQEQLLVLGLQGRFRLPKAMISHLPDESVLHFRGGWDVEKRIFRLTL